jgi:hypothetical protein
MIGKADFALDMDYGRRIEKAARAQSGMIVNQDG